MNLDQEIELLVSELALSLIQHKSLLLSAESCTGGMLAKYCTDIAGSSAWYEGGVVSYSNSFKQTSLNVPLSTLKVKGAVSEETAQAMALGACRLVEATKTKIGISVTGVAGPGGGTAEKPVGMVCFAWARETAEHVPELLKSETRMFTGSRDRIRKQSVHYALNELLTLLLSSE